MSALRTLDSLCSLIVDCEHKTAPLSSDGYPSIRTPNIGRGRLLLDGVNRVSEETYRAWTMRALPKAGDLIVAREAPVGNVAIIPPGLEVCLGQRTVLIRPDSHKVDAQFLCYFMLGQYVQSRFIATASGATVPHLNMRDIRGLPMPALPSLRVQRRIASILGAYDDLIEVNRRRIAVLEEMARRLFEEWFVHFRFPGYETVRFTDSDMGQLPATWQPKSLGKLLSHAIGGGWGQEVESEEFSVPAYVIRGTDIPDVRRGSLGRSPLRFHTPSNFRSRKVQRGDIVFEVSGGSKDQPVGRAVLLGERLLSRASHLVICASFCKLVRADEALLLPELLQFHFERIYENREILKYQTQSTGITNFKFTVFLEKEFLLQPDPSTQFAFAAKVRPLLSLAEALGVQNDLLRDARDLLLPKLIAGEIELTTAERDLVAVA